MATEDKRREFDEIAARLAAEDPSLTRIPLLRWRRSVLIPALGAAAFAWGLLSVAMVVWGWGGVALTCLIVASAVTAGVVDARRRHG